MKDKNHFTRKKYGFIIFAVITQQHSTNDGSYLLIE